MIHMLGRLKKFFINDQFGETIIKKNKDKVKPSTNAISYKFLEKTIALNIILFAKIRKVMAIKIGAINYCN